MAYRYTDVNTRAVYSTKKGTTGQAGKLAKFWLDSAGTLPVDIGLYDDDTPETPGPSTGSNVLQVQADGMWPAMWDRAGTQDHVWVQVGTPTSPGELYRIFCDADQRADLLAEAVQAAQDAADAAQATADTRETPSGAQARADAAQAAAIAAAAGDATSKANAAAVAAISAAAVDATTKANAAQAAAVQRSNHTGTQSADTLTDGSTNRLFSSAEKTKLAGVATGATANSTDAQLRDRSTHSGSQAINTVTGLQTALDGKVSKGDLVINVKDFLAVGDCAYVDQRVSSGTWGLAGATPTDAATFGRGFKNSSFTTPATDNTAAFRNAWDALMNAGVVSLRDRNGYKGYRSQRLGLRIPAGAYYIGDGAALFSLLRVSLTGTQAGIKIQGDGRNNTILYVRIPASGATDYLFYDNNWFNELAIDGVDIICTTGTERVIYQTSTGNAKRWKLTDVYFEDYKTCVTIDGSLNADRWVFQGCEWYTSVAGARLFNNQGNTQALGFDFHSPAITHLAGGDVFDIGAGTVARVFGGTTDLFGLGANGAAGRAVYIHGNGTALGKQIDPAIVFYDHRFELHDDAGLVDVNFNQAVFRDCTIVPISNTRIANGLKAHIVARGRGGVVVNGGIVNDPTYVALSTSLASDYQSSGKATVLIKDAKIEYNNFIADRVSYYTDAGDGLTTLFSGTGTGTGTGIGRLQIEGCNAYDANYSSAPPTHIAVNGAPYATSSWHGRPPRVQRVTHKHGNAKAFGLPAEGQTAIVRVPVGCELLKVGIVKQVLQSGIGSNSRTWRVTDGNGTVLVTLTALGTDTNVKSVSADILRVLSSANDCTLTLSCDPATPSSAGTGAEGYFFVEYI